MKPCGLGLARDKQSMSFARHSEFEEKSAVCGLINFLDSRLRQHRPNFLKHAFDFGGAQCHVVQAFQNGEITGLVADAGLRPGIVTQGCLRQIVALLSSRRRRRIRMRFSRIEMQIT